MDQLPVADADAILNAAYGDRPRSAADIDAWAMEAHDAAGRGCVKQAIGLYRRVLAAGATPRTPVLVELARLRCRCAASKAVADRAPDLDAAIGRLEQAAREPGGLPATALADDDFAPLREDVRFRTLAAVH